MRILKENTLGLVIDIQERLFPFIAENQQLTENVKRLIDGLKILEVPIIVTEQYKKGLGLTIPEISNSIGNFEPLEKMAFSCCDDEAIINAIVASGKKNILLCGIESHICVLQTTIDLIEKGFTPIVVADCISSRNLYNKKIALKRMIKEGAIVTTYESILFELCRVAGGDQFKGISKLIK
jgi:nicotinamidase-related amidase